MLLQQWVRQMLLQQWVRQMLLWRGALLLSDATMPFKTWVSCPLSVSTPVLAFPA